MNIWTDLDSDRVTKDKFICYIEISKGSKNKYELDKETGLLRLDRILSTSTHYPANYGFIPLTYCGDDDPLDVLVLCNESILPMTILECYPIGVLKMKDQEATDEKIIAVACGDPSMNLYTDISELPKHIFNEIQHFFTVYKQLEEKNTEVLEICGSNEAKNVIIQSINMYKKKFNL